MKRIVTLLSIVGALFAFAVPASAMAETPIVVSPAGHTFKISGTNMPEIKGSLTGSCKLTALSGSVPAAPNNQGVSVALPLATPTATCSSGMSIAFSPTGWTMHVAQAFTNAIAGPVNGITIRYASLPGCKLTTPPTTPAALLGMWSNALSTSGQGHTAYIGYSGNLPYVWANDGGTCALAGQTEEVNYGGPATGYVNHSPIVDTTVGGTTLTVTSGGF